MKFTVAAALLIIGICVTGCLSHYEDDLRGVPVTNNPTLFPSGHTAQGPGFGK